MWKLSIIQMICKVIFNFEKVLIRNWHELIYEKQTVPIKNWWTVRNLSVFMWRKQLNLIVKFMS